MSIGTRVFLLDHFDSFTFNVVQGLRQAGADVQVQEDDTATAVDLTDFTHVVLSPGAGHPRATKLGRAVLTEAIKRGLPVLGICLGHQIIARHFGATIVRMDHPAHAQECLITHNGTGLFADAPYPMQVGQYHSLHVTDVTAPLTITARSETGLVMAVQHTTQPIYGIQFHPESVFTPQGQTILENFLRL